MKHTSLSSSADTCSTRKPDLYGEVKPVLKDTFEFVLRDRNRKEVAHATGYLLRNWVVVVDMAARKPRQGHGTIVLEKLKELYNRPVVPVAVLASAKPFWDKWLKKQEGGKVDERSLLLAIAAGNVEKIQETII